MQNEYERYISIWKKKVFKETINSLLALRQDLNYGIYVGISMQDFVKALNVNKVTHFKTKYVQEIVAKCSFKIPNDFIEDIQITSPFYSGYFPSVNIASNFKYLKEITLEVSKEESYLVAEKDPKLWME